LNTNHSPATQSPRTPADPAPHAANPESEESRYPIRRGVVGTLGFYGGLFVTRLIVRLRARGTKNITTQIPYVIAANHQTYVDGLLISAFLPRFHFKKLASLTAKDLEDQHGLFGKLIVRVGRGIAVDRFGNPIRGLIIAKKKVEEGNILLVHPEGTRSPTGELGEMKDGAAYIAIKSKVPLLPVFIEGGYEVFSRHMKWPRPFDRKTGKRREITVVFGKPFDPKEFKNAKELTEALVAWMEAQASAYRLSRGLAAT